MAGSMSVTTGVTALRQ